MVAIAADLAALERIVDHLERGDSSPRILARCRRLHERIEALINAEHRRLWGVPPKAE